MEKDDNGGLVGDVLIPMTTEEGEEYTEVVNLEDLEAASDMFDKLLTEG